jgi:hypothetical protein
MTLKMGATDVLLLFVDDATDDNRARRMLEEFGGISFRVVRMRTGSVGFDLPAIIQGNTVVGGLTAIRETLAHYKRIRQLN